MMTHHECSTTTYHPGETYDCWKISRRTQTGTVQWQWSKPQPEDKTEAKIMTIAGMVLGLVGIIVSAASWGLIRHYHQRELETQHMPNTSQAEMMPPPPPTTAAIV